MPDDDDGGSNINTANRTSTSTTEVSLLIRSAKCALSFPFIIMQHVKAIFDDFANNTTITGVQYINDSQLHWFEKYI